jgi:hypothetical protein
MPLHTIPAPENDPKHRLLVYEPIAGCVLTPLQPFYAVFMLPVAAAIIAAIMLPPEYDPAKYQPLLKRLAARAYLMYQCVAKPAAAVATLVAAVPVVCACPSLWASYQCFGLIWASTPFLVNCFSMTGIYWSAKNGIDLMLRFYRAHEGDVEKIVGLVLEEDPLMVPRLPMVPFLRRVDHDAQLRVDQGLEGHEEVLTEKTAYDSTEGLLSSLIPWGRDKRLAKLQQKQEETRRDGERAGMLSILKEFLIKSADHWRRLEKPADRGNVLDFLAWRAKHGAREHGSTEAELSKPTAGAYIFATHKKYVSKKLACILGVVALGPLLPFVFTHILPGAIVFFPVTTLPTLLCLGLAKILEPNLVQKSDEDLWDATDAVKLIQTKRIKNHVYPAAFAFCGVVVSLWVQQCITMAAFLYQGDGWSSAVHETFSDRTAKDYVTNLWHEELEARQGSLEGLLDAAKSQYEVFAQLIAQGS